MALGSLQRRTARLERVFAVDSVAQYPPLTADEMQTLADRKANGDKWTDVETARVIRQCPYIHCSVDGSLSIHGSKGEVYIKRIIGVDTTLV